ncbi:MAG: LamG domain-containing protein [Deltaproteobacteria bacterium]|nr:LamG domain-containing protein [Deltaproteobacteria bacterium]
MKCFISLILLATIILFPTKIMAQELVLYYPFEGTGDKVADESGEGNDGEFDAGGAKRVASKDNNFGKAMEFDGASRIAVKESDSLKIDTEISFVMWVKKADEAGGTGTLPRIISRAGDVHELAMDSGHMVRGNFAIYFGNNPGWTSCMPVGLDWHHIAVTFDGGTFNVYLDGEPAFDLKAGGGNTFGGALYVGSRHDLPSNESYAGLLDELGVYAGVLTQNKVAEIMTGGVLGQLLAVSPQNKLASRWSSIKAKY